MSKLDPKDPAFPIPQYGRGGISRREYYALHAPAPDEALVNTRLEQERLANPHGDGYKPTRHSPDEIRCILRWEWADRMMAMAEVKS